MEQKIRNIDLEIPVKENGEVNFYKLESDLGRFLCNNPENAYVNVLGKDKFLAKEVRDNLQSSFDYKILGIGKRSNNYLIKVGASNFTRETWFINNERSWEQKI